MHHDKRSSSPRWRAAASRPGLAVLASVLACAGGMITGPAAQAAAGPAAQAAGHPGSAAAATPATVNPQLLGVSAVSSKDAWAAGYYETYAGTGGNIGAPPIILHWNGTSWKKAAIPNPGGATGRNQLTAVSADAANDAWAVGDYQTSDNPFPTDSLILHWNGTSWKQVASPSPGGTTGLTSLSGVYAVSATDVWAVGSYTGGSNGDSNEPLILHWNGASWKQVASPSPGGTSGTTALAGVSAVSANNVWATGYYGMFPQYAPPISSLIGHWTGTSWKQVASPNPGGTTSGSYTELFGVSATSATSAWSVGLSETTFNGPTRPLILRWNGTSWKQVASPNPGGTSGFPRLEGVSALSTKDAWATGYYNTGTSPYQSLILHWNGASWKQVASPSPGGATGYTLLQGVSVASAKDAWAVGSYSTQCGDCAPQSLILHWNGTSWKQVTSPS